MSIWKKYPDEKPIEGKTYIFVDNHKQIMIGFQYDFMDIERELDLNNATHWCYESDLLATIDQPTKQGDVSELLGEISKYTKAGGVTEVSIKTTGDMIQLLSKIKNHLEGK